MSGQHMNQKVFALRFCPEIKTGFKVVNQFNEMKFINKVDHQLLYSKMSKYKQREADEYQQKYIEKPDKTDFLHNRQYEINIEDKQNFTEKTNGMAICFIYYKESKEKLLKLQKQYQEVQTDGDLIILVNGQKSLDKSLLYILEGCREQQQQRIKQDSNEIFYCNFMNNINWFILQQPLKYNKLIELIYQGIFRFFDKQYCLILDLQIEVDKNGILSMIQQLKENKNSFGIQATVQLNDQTSSSLPKILGLYYNYLQYSVDILNDIKWFHTPFFCCYDWYKVQKYVDEYINQLKKQKDIISMKINHILPTLINKDLIKCQGINCQITVAWQMQYAFQELSILQSQLTTCYSNAYKTLRQSGNLKCCLYFIKLFQHKTSLAFNLFIFIIAPFQMFHQNTDSKLLQVLVAIIIPYFFIISSIIFILLPQQFKITALKSTKQIVKLYFKENSNEFIMEPNVQGIKKEVYGQYIQIESEETNLLIYRKPINIKDKAYQKQLKLKKGNSNYSTTYLELQIKKKITYLYKHLFNAFIIITISSIILLFIDIIVTYILNLLNPIRLTTFLLIICFLIIQFTRYFLLMRVNNWRQAGFIILSMFMYNMIVVQFTQIYHQLYFQKNPFLYCERVSKLGEYLILTLTILLIFTIIENQTHFNGYVLLGIFSFYTIVNIFEIVFLVVALRQKKIQISPYDCQDESQNSIRQQ